MTGKGIKVLLSKRRWLVLVTVGLLGALSLVGMAAATSAPSPAASQLPEYVGSKACLGCHADQYAKWQPSGHAHMLDPVVKLSDLPGDYKQATKEQQAILLKADYIVAGQRFVGKDPVSGELKYLDIQYDKAANVYKTYKGGASWEKGCAGCHTTGWDIKNAQAAETSIGCEACHGPGRDHILGKGDRTKIVSNTSVETCGSCHNGGKMPDGTRWPVGFKPGMKVSDTGFKLTEFDASKGAPDPVLHLRQFAPLLATTKLEGVHDLATNDHAQARCYECHSADVVLAVENQGHAAIQNLDVNKVNAMNDGLSCVACHAPHGSDQPAQLRVSPEALCIECHTAEIPAGQKLQPGKTAHHSNAEIFEGRGAIGVPDTTGPHSVENDVTCVNCHMAESNHMFKVILPKDVMGTNRKDACVTCHETSSPEIRQSYLDFWQGNVKAKMETLKTRITAAEAVMKSKVVSKALKDKVASAKSNLSLIEADGSMGAHNYEYVMKILSASEKMLAEFEAGTK